MAALAPGRNTKLKRDVNSSTQNLGRVLKGTFEANRGTAHHGGGVRESRREKWLGSPLTYAVQAERWDEHRTLVNRSPQTEIA